MKRTDQNRTPKKANGEEQIGREIKREERQ